MTVDRRARQRRAAALARTLRNFTQDLARVRREQGLSQEQIAGLLGVTQPAVAKMERYDANPTLSSIRRYALAVDADIEIIVTAAKKPDAAPEPTVPNESPTQLERVAASSGLEEVVGLVWPGNPRLTRTEEPPTAAAHTFTAAVQLADFDLCQA